MPGSGVRDLGKEGWGLAEGRTKQFGNYFEGFGMFLKCFFTTTTTIIIIVIGDGAGISASTAQRAPRAPWSHSHGNILQDPG